MSIQAHQPDHRGQERPRRGPPIRQQLFRIRDTYEWLLFPMSSTREVRSPPFPPRAHPIPTTPHTHISISKEKESIQALRKDDREVILFFLHPPIHTSKLRGHSSQYAGHAYMHALTAPEQDKGKGVFSSNNTQLCIVGTADKEERDLIAETLSSSLEQ